MTEKELYNEYRKSDYKTFTDFLLNKITGLEKENLDLRDNYTLFKASAIPEIEKLKQENAKLKKFLFCKGECIEQTEQLTKATGIIKEFLSLRHDCKEKDCPCESPICETIDEKAGQFLKVENIILEDVQAGNSPFDADKVFNKEMKAYPDETLGFSDIHKYSHKLFDAFAKLEFRTTFNKAIQAFYLEEGLYVVRSDSLGKYQYTLVKASSEEMAIRKCM